MTLGYPRGGAQSWDNNFVENLEPRGDRDPSEEVVPTGRGRCIGTLIEAKLVILEMG